MKQVKITVKRNTGFMGAASRASLKVDQQKVKSLKHNEKVEIEIQGDSVEVSANQWFLGSKPVKVNAGEQVEIQMNSTSIPLFIGVLILLILSLFMNNGIVSGVAFLGILGTIIYLVKNYYVIKSGSSSRE